MTLPDLLRRFHHLTLTAACVCLIVALQPILPRLGPLLWPLAMLTLLAGRVEGRWTLSAWLANCLALLATFTCLGWIYRNWHLLAVQPMPIILVPYIGPLLIVLLVLRLYRPRSPRDLWMLQGMGLLQVALACILTTELLFGLLLLLYLALALPLLALAQMDQARQRAGLDEQAVPVPRLGGRIVLWTVIVFAVGLTLFLATPRIHWQPWDPLRQLGVRKPVERGQKTFSSRMDINHLGPVQLGTEEAFRVRVLPDELNPTATLPADVYWRTGVLNVYHKGIWRWEANQFPFRGPPQDGLPPLAFGQILLSFEAEVFQAGGLPLAEPILVGPPGQRRTISFAPFRYPFVEMEGTLLLSQVRESSVVYRQICRPGLSRWPLDLPPHQGRAVEVFLLVRKMTEMPLPELAGWTRDLLERLARERRFGLRPDLLPPPGEGVPPGTVPARAEPIARALTGYLASSGDFTYSLERTRRDPDLDPTLDFLWNIRQGHCERFASALTLMLRSQGIPARVVRGFHGGQASDDGTHVVWQKNAHAWVEALVPAREPGHPQKLDWISLDATPSVDALASRESFLWNAWADFSAWQEHIWRDLIVGYDADHQAAFWGSWLLAWQGASLALGAGVTLVALVGLALLVRSLKRSWRRTADDPLASLPFLHRLWDVLRRHRLLHHDPNRTPRELADAARAALLAHPAGVAHADLPARLVDLYYRIRFGGAAVDPEEMQRAEAEVAALASDLSQVRRADPVPA